jgi:hypothetical protein
VLVGTVRVVATGRGEGRRIFTEPGAAEYHYELSINEVVGDAQSAARTSYRLPITMSDIDEAYLERVHGYHQTAAYQKVYQKRKVWVEPLFGEAQQSTTVA